MWGVDMDVSSYAFRDLPGCTEADGGPTQGTVAAGAGPGKPFFHHQQHGGFTLIELLISLTLLITLVTLGVPALQAMVSTNRLAGGVNDLVGTLAFARSEAVKRNQEVVVCQSNNGHNCSRDGDWRDGWLVYLDRNGNRQKNAGEPILGQYTGLVDDLHLTYRAFGSTRYVVYRPSGMTRTNGTFTFCDPANPALARAIILTKSGRPRRSAVSASGTPLECGG
jgi:type IV fimbrial biogenesis protein FimT